MSVINVIEDTFFANGRYWGGLNASLYNSGSIWAMKTGIESADLNMVWNETPLTADDSRAIQNIKKDFRKAGLPFWWWVFPRAKSQSTIERLETEGFSFVDSIPCMLADLTLLPDPGSCNPAISIVSVKSREDLNLWKEVSFDGFDFPSQTRDQYDRFTATFNLNPDSPQKFLLVFVNGKPVGTSLLFLTDHAAGIYFVTTLADHRKKGIGLELTQATMRYAGIAGARFATLQSSPDGLRVYQQAGFKEYCRVAVYSLSAG
ncbi:MAG: GNAT family N-acetyltransferase [Smithella sp.]